MCISVELKNWMSAASIQDTLYMFKEGKGNSAWLVYFGTRVNILHTPTTHSPHPYNTYYPHKLPW